MIFPNLFSIIYNRWFILKIRVLQSQQPAAFVSVIIGKTSSDNVVNPLLHK